MINSFRPPKADKVIISTDCARNSHEYMHPFIHEDFSTY